MLSSLKSLLPHKMWQWLSTSMADAEPQQWKPFKLDAHAPPAVELARWQKHARFPANTRIPDCIGVRTVQDLQHVSPKLKLTVMRPVHQARLRWALRSYQEQLVEQRQAFGAAAAEKRDSARDQARNDVAAAYNTHRAKHDVYHFIEELCRISSNSKLDAAKLSPPLAAGAPGWKEQMLRIIRQAYVMAHPDKHHGAPAMHYAYACETFLKLKEWEHMIRLRH